METTYITDKTFDKIDYSAQGLPMGEYEECCFTGCNLSNINLSKISFSDCEFIGCNLSLAKLSQTAFKNCKFTNCKLLGLLFNDCSDFLFAVSFDNCILNLACFYKRKMKNTVFKNCSLQEVDFTEVDLSNAVFINCDFAKATFYNTNLEKVDLRTSFNYSINPENNKIKKARFSVSGVIGLLDQYDIVIE